MNKIRLTYKYIFAILGLGTNLSIYLFNVIDGTEIASTYSGNYEIYTIDFFTTFTMLSNLFVLFWLLAAAVFWKKEGDCKLLSYSSAMVGAIYITVTFLIYNFILVPIDTGFPTKQFDQYVSVINHIITPIAFVIYFLFLMSNKKEVNLNDFILKRFYIIFCIIIGYCLLVMIRGELRFRSSGDLYVGENHNLLYPYFFLNVHEVGPLNIPGFAWFLIAFFLILGIMVGFTYLYNWLNNLIIKQRFYQ